MKRESFIIGSREFAAHKIAAFEANSLILKIQKLVLPVLGGMAGNKSVMDMDVNSVFQVISEKLDDSVMTDIVLPMFQLAQVVCVSDNTKVVSKQDINKVFEDADGLADLYELIFEVMKYQFGDFFSRLMARFGSKDGSQKAKE